MNIIQKFNFTNSQNRPIVLILEPWCEEYNIAKGQTIEIIGTSEADGFFEVELAEDTIIVYGWSGSKVTILC